MSNTTEPGGGNTYNNNPNSIWLYNPNLAAAIVFTVLYFIPTAVMFWQTIFKYRSYYFSVVIFGACLEVGGYAARAASIEDQESVTPYAISNSFIVLAPLFIGAGNYLLISRLCNRVLPSKHSKIFGIPTKRLTLIFVICDIITLLVQVAGTSIASSNDWEGPNVRVGENVLIAGLAAQLCCFSLFLAVVGRFHALTTTGTRETAGDGWKRVLLAVYVSSVLIVVRCIYRLIEFALGIFGYPFTHEWMFYVFEAILMLPAIGIFCIWHPGAYFGAGGRKTGKESLDIPLERSAESDGSRA